MKMKINRYSILLLLISSHSFAQSSVNVYGIMDAGYSRISDAGASAKNQVRSGNLLTSRIGFRGNEDLGPGLKANFVLEGGLAADNGSASTPFFNRQSWLGISSRNYGEVRFGRMLPIGSDIFSAFINASYLGNATAALDGAAVGIGSSVDRFNNMFGGSRLNNTLKYQTPEYSGFKGHFMTAFGEVAGSSSAGRSSSIGGSFNSKNTELGITYHEKECSSNSGCNSTQDKEKIFGLGVAYKSKGARYAILFSKQENSLNVKNNNADSFSLLTQIPVGDFLFSAGLQFLNDKTTTNQDVTQINLGVNYLISKRTQAYTLYSHQKVSNNGRAGMYLVTARGDKQSQFSFGLAHRF